MITIEAAREFLSLPRIAVVGVSTNPKKFGNVVHRELLEHGYDAIGVHPAAPTVNGARCYSDLSAVPADIDGAIVMVAGASSAQVVRDCIASGLTRVWLFKGIGAHGADTDEAVELCRSHGIDVIAGACPLMFLEPVRGFHRFHRGMRRLNRSVGPAA